MEAQLSVFLLWTKFEKRCLERHGMVLRYEFEFCTFAHTSVDVKNVIFAFILEEEKKIRY